MNSSRNPDSIIGLKQTADHAAASGSASDNFACDSNWYNSKAHLSSTVGIDNQYLPYYLLHELFVGFVHYAYSARRRMDQRQGSQK